MNKIYLNVPYREKNHAKALGARWDQTQQRWFISAALNTANFTRWLPPPETIPLPLPSREITKPCITLSQLLAPLRTLVQQTQGLWIQAEIESLKQTQQGHCYLNLVEHDENKQRLAAARANIWAQQAQSLLSKFSEQTGYDLAENQQVRIKVKTDLHPIYGFSLTIEDIDPTFTLGAIIIKLKQIREQLQREGLYQIQKTLTLPQDFFNVAVIAPLKSSALADFQRISEPLQPACSFHHFSATFQGKNSIPSLQTALNAVLTQHKKQMFDTCIIIRGGGSKGDLHYLNDYDLAKKICTCPVPVLSGIGHETDMTILDEVCAARFSTPTKVAIFVRDSIAKSCHTTLTHWQTIKQHSQYQAKQYQNTLTRKMVHTTHFAQQNLLKQKQQLTVFQPLALQAKQVLKHHKQHLIHLHQSFALNSKHYRMITLQKHQNRHKHIRSQLLSDLRHQKHQMNQYKPLLDKIHQTFKQRSQSLEHLYQLIQQNHPARLLNKGYAIVHQKNAAIKHVKQLKTDQPFSITFSDGSIQLDADERTNEST